MNEPKLCPDCGVSPGKIHLAGCDIELCAECGWQRISCDCETKKNMKWSGEYPTVDACRQLGWYAKLVPRVGWVPCVMDDPDATEDINRMYREAVWDKTKQQFVRRGTK